MKFTTHSIVAVVGTVFLAVMPTLIGCQSKDETTTKSITVTYALDEPITDAHKIDDVLDEWSKAETLGTIPGKIEGDATHPSQVTASVLAPSEEAFDADSVVLGIPSPGFSGSEKMSVERVTFRGMNLIVKYEKMSPAETIEDFQQVTTYVRVHRAPGSGPSPSDVKAADPYADVLENEPVIHQTSGGELQSDGWCEARATRGNFSVMMPGQFVDTMIKSATPTGGIGVMHSISTKTDDGIEFTVLQTEVIGERPDGSALDLMKARFEQLGATMIQESVVHGDLEGVLLSVKAKGVAAEMLLLQSANSDYMVAVQAAPEAFDDEQNRANVERFLHSFKLDAIEDQGTEDQGTKDQGTKDQGTKDQGTKDQGTGEL